MIRAEGHEFRRGGEKIGYLSDEHIKNHSGDVVGYFLDERIFDKSGHKLAYLDGDYIHFCNSSHKIRIEDNNKDVVGGDLTNVERAAVRILLGE